MATLPGKADIVSQMRQALAISEPDLDTSIGTTTRKLLDAVAEVVNESQVDTYLLNYVYDVDAKTGKDLDAFVANWGFARLEAKRASGTLTYSRTTPATQDIFIPLGSQVSTSDIVPVVAVTLAAAVLVVNETQIEIPCQVVLGGAGGNIQANKLTNFVSPIAGLTAVTNAVSLSGGADAESDDALRSRFKKSALRNMAGTEQMFIGVALEDPSVSQVNVVGASKTHFEQIDLVGGTGTSTVADSAYTYPDGFFFGPDVAGGDIFTPEVHYSFDPSTQPTVTRLDAGVVPDAVYQLQFQYVSAASRNEPLLGITNRVDVWVNGVREVEATETLIWRSAPQFNDVSTDPLFRQNFVRDDGSPPDTGNHFVRFGFSPVTNPTIIDKITFDGNDYFNNVDFFLVNDITAFGLAPRSRSGIEWISQTNGAPQADPSEGSNGVSTYRYNEVPAKVEAAMEAWRLVTTDVWVHQANLWRLDFFLAVILQTGYDLAPVEADMALVLENYLRNIEFNGVLQISDVIAVAHSVGGVESVRFLNSDDDAVDFGIARVDSTGAVIENINDGGATARSIDIIFGDNELPILNSVTLSQKAQNTFHSPG